MHPFDEAIHLQPLDTDRASGATHPAYANMVGPFGGTTAAVLLNGALQHPARLGDPVSLTVNFAAPVADGAFEVEARPVRTNRSTQHWWMQLAQQGEVAATASAVFALRRPSWSDLEAPAPQDLPPAAALTRASVEGRPAWVARYDMRFAQEGPAMRLDGVEQPHSESLFWVRDDPPRPLDFAALASICDCFFPRIFLRRGRPAPIGTVSLTTHFHADATLLAAQHDRRLLASARALNFRDGYFDQRAEVWDDQGRLLASSQQMVYYRDDRPAPGNFGGT